MSVKIAMVTADGKNTFNADQVARLRQAGDPVFSTATRELGPAELARLLDGASVAGLTPRSVPVLGPDVVAALPPSLRGVAVFATGTDFVDVASLQARGIALAHLPDYSAVSVAEHTIGLLLTLSRRLHLSRDRVLGRVAPGTSVRGWQLAGKTLGVIGLGRIGSKVALLAQAFGMRVLATDPRGGVLAGVALCDLDELLARADAVTVHAPAVFAGPPLLAAAEITRLKPGAVVVNTSRARLVDEAAIVAAVREHRIAGYAVDDRLTDRPAAARLLAEGRIVETGHTAWYSQEALDKGLDTWVGNVTALAAGCSRLPVPAAPGLIPALATSAP